jgi:predicted DNA-binding transcriptional regulator AlpA
MSKRVSRFPMFCSAVGCIKSSPNPPLCPEGKSPEWYARHPKGRASHQTAGPSGNGRLLTILEVAAMLGISRSSIYRLFGSGKLCWVRAAGDVSLSPRSIDLSAPTPRLPPSFEPGSQR